MKLQGVETVAVFMEILCHIKGALYLNVLRVSSNVALCWEELIKSFITSPSLWTGRQNFDLKCTVLSKIPKLVKFMFFEVNVFNQVCLTKCSIHLAHLWGFWMTEHELVAVMSYDVRWGHITRDVIHDEVIWWHLRKNGRPMLENVQSNWCSLVRL